MCFTRWVSTVLASQPEQYAIETGQHPAETTKKILPLLKASWIKLVLLHDWEREVQTSDPNYYKWTQWIFLQLYNGYYNNEKKAESIDELIEQFEEQRFMVHGSLPTLLPNTWNGPALMKPANGKYSWWTALPSAKYGGKLVWSFRTVLANDEVVNGVSERGSHPWWKKKMRQWYLRITDIPTDCGGFGNCKL